MERPGPQWHERLRDQERVSLEEGRTQEGGHSPLSCGIALTTIVSPQTWKKRWFVLRATHLAYYKTSAEYRLLRLLDLTEVHACVSVSLKRHDNCFGLVAPARTFYLQAERASDVQGWVAAVNEARERAKATSPRSSVIAVPALAEGLSGGPAPPPAPARSQPIPIPSRDSNALPPPPPISQSPGQGITSSDSEDASISPSRQGRTRAYSRASASGVPPPPTPGVAASSFKAAGIQSADPSKTVVSGYLMKCGSKRRNWRKRWFVLTGDKLFYMGSHMVSLALALSG